MRRYPLTDDVHRDIRYFSNLFNWHPDIIELHGNYIEDNIVLYGQEMHNPDKAIDLIKKIAKEAKEEGKKAILLIIGTSMQTAFANVLVLIARANGMKDLYIDKNADEEVEEFFNLINA